MSNRNVREKSSSITQLVKTVAKEVNEHRIRSVEERMSRIETQAAGWVGMGTEFHKRIESDLRKAGEFWTDSEHQILVEEVATAIATIAKNHHRSHGAIRARINQNDMI